MPTYCPAHSQPHSNPTNPIAQAVRLLVLAISWAAVSAQAQNSAAGAVQEPTSALPPVTVKASRSTASEGTGDYTVGGSASATGLNLSLRDTPQSVTVITRERMDAQGMSSVADVLRNTTGVSIKATDRGRNTVTVRGFDVTSFQYDGSSMATGNIGGETGNTAMYDRVEVVRGSTGLLNGAGNPSASVNLVRKHADSKVFTGSVSAELGSWNQRSGALDLSTPLNQDGSVRARLVADVSQQDAFIDLENTDNTLLYAVVDADLGRSTRLSLGASDQNDKRNGVYWGGLGYWYADGSRTDWARSKTTATRWNQWDTREQTAFATLEHTLPNRWRLRGDLSYHKQVEDSKLLWVTGLSDRRTGLGMSASPYHYHTEPTQSNITLTATGPLALWGRSHEISIGVLRSKLKEGWGTDVAASSTSTVVGNFNTWDGSFPAPQWNALQQGDATTTTQTGGYVAARLQLADPLKLILGARMSNWVRDGAVGAWTEQAYSIRHNNVFTPYAGLVYDLHAQLSAYASITDIFNPQTARDRNGNYLDPLQGRSYEAGVKGEFLDATLQTSAAVFRIDQDNLAVTDSGYLVPGTTTTASRAAQGTRAQGYELEASGTLAPGWKASLGWTHFRAKDAQGVDVAADYPRKLLKVFTQYTLTGAARGLSLGGGVDWEGSTPRTETNPATGLVEHVGQTAYALVNLMARFDFNKQWAAQLNVSNVFDKKYRSTSWSGYTYGEPRRVLLTAKYSF